MKIAIVDDNVHLVKSIERFFLKAGNHVGVFHSRKEFMDHEVFDFDVYILDINLEDGNGLDIANHLRNTENIDAPILVISGYQGLQTKLEGFKIGIDDYIVKPFSPLELEARIKSITKKSKPAPKENISYRNILFDNEQRKVMLDGEEIEFSKKEKQILEFLMMNQDVFVSKDTLIESVWGSDHNPEKINNTLNVSICKIRKKLGDTFLLDTINSEGYILKNDTPGLQEKITLDHVMS